MGTIRLHDGSRVALRPLATDDGERLRRLFHRLSPTSVYRRFRSPVPAPRAACLARLLDVDHDQREALAAVVGDEVVAVARYARLAGGEAELALLVEDAWQRRGLGGALARRLAAVARRRGVRAFQAFTLGENVAAIRLLRRLSPAARLWWADGEIQAEVPLRGAPGLWFPKEGPARQAARSGSPLN
jgi:GNAT superfamily N-acetyltransferase